MMINLSNHPSAAWSSKQRTAAEVFGPIQDFPFPKVDPLSSEEQLDILAEEIASQAEQLAPKMVLCQGENTLMYRLINRLLEKNIPVCAACSERRVTENINEKGIVEKQSLFEFVCFRGYGTPAA